MDIQKAAVIGAGVMGASIAAHIANAGVPVVLLDIVPEGAENRNAIAEGAIAKLLKAEPAPLMLADYARLITPGNIEDHLGLLADVDWIVEAVIENPEIKQDLYKKLDLARKRGSAVSSNTSTIPLARLTRDMPETFCRDFLITHFFNPPRYMRLLELVASADTRTELIECIRAFADRKLGKGVVDCKDTPGFIGNRIGIFWLQCALTDAIANGITVEQADAVMGAPAGIPKTGVFGLLDLVGLDLMPHIIDSMKRSLPPDDAFHAIAEIPEIVSKLVALGYTGRKGKGGFYRLNPDKPGKIKESVDLLTGEFRLSEKPKLDSVAAAKTGGLRAMLGFDDATGRYAWRVLGQTLRYAAQLVPEISDDIVSVDQAMKLGYNWQFGPFELIDQLGAPWFAEKLRSNGMAVPPLLDGTESFYGVDGGRLHHLGVDKRYRPLERPADLALLSDIKRASEPLRQNGSASLWDTGDGVLCLEFHTKMNTLDGEIMALIGQAIDLIRNSHKALVIHNEAEHFSAGANLGILMAAIGAKDWQEVDKLLKQGQDVYKALKYAPFPVVAAPSGLALGGGCEILLHCDAVQAHGELYTGLVEVGVGLIPGWGGCKELLRRWQNSPKLPNGPMPAIAKAFEIIAMAQVSKSAADARRFLFPSSDFAVTMNKERLLTDAKAKALTLCRNYSPPESPEFHLPGPSGKAALMMAIRTVRNQGKATEYDEVVSTRVAEVLTGADADPTMPLGEDDLLALERRVFLDLVKDPRTLARLQHMLETGKPLRN